MGEPLSEREQHVLEHTTGWRSRSPGYRNRFCASEGHDDWQTLHALVERGLMARNTRVSPALTGGDAVFIVTEAGLERLRAMYDGRCNVCRRELCGCYEPACEKCHCQAGPYADPTPAPSARADSATLPEKEPER